MKFSRGKWRYCIESVILWNIFVWLENIQLKDTVYIIK